MDEKLILLQDRKCADIRKEENDKLQNQLNILKEHISNSNVSFKNMQENLKRLEVNQKEGFNELQHNQKEGFEKIENQISLLINKSSTTFATKEKLLITDGRIKKLENGVRWLIGLVGSVIIIAIVSSQFK